MDSWNACIRPQNVQHYRMVAHRRTCTRSKVPLLFQTCDVFFSTVQYSKTSPTLLQLQLGAIYLGQYFWLGIQSACTKKWLAWGKRGGLRLRLTVLIPLLLFPSITGVFSLVFSLLLLMSVRVFSTRVLWKGCGAQVVLTQESTNAFPISDDEMTGLGLVRTIQGGRFWWVKVGPADCFRAENATGAILCPSKKTTMFKMIALFTLFCALAASANAANCRCSWTPEK